ncbi:MAG: hypothetical protein KF689_01315 [Gemmatimonadaceae bacterium]|nr:hypothetical protein [Gemmatimonadaceae bacterium]MCW5826569.1 hypothetical protein [Gemmatimonadaceae bacterium]
MRRRLGEAPLPDPERHWTAIRARLATTDVPRWRRPLPPMVAVAATLAALVLGAGAGTYRQFAAPSEWVAMAAASGVALDSNWLETGDDTLRLAVGRIGEVALAPGSRARIARGAWHEHRLVLERGALDAVIAAPPRLFFVETPSAVAADLGCVYQLEVTEDGGTALHVSAGWVELGRGDARVLVPAGLSARVRAGGVPGIPHVPSWPREVIASLERVAAAEGGGAAVERTLAALDSLDAGLPAIVRRQTTGITLWHLLQRVEGPSRRRVIDALAARAERPAGVTTEGIVALDRQMLDRWRRSLHPMWGEEPGPMWVVAAQRVWLWLMD